ncbi:MAG: response regulator transcription factor [Bacteroidetes bacterium]|nr:response regulator transcription factor [Bacteroidota bacterium]
MPEMTEPYIELIIADDSNIIIECMKHWIKDAPNVELIAIVHSAELLKSLLEIHENAIILSSFYWIMIQGKAKISPLISNNPTVSYALLLHPNDYNTINGLIDIGIKGFFGYITTQEDMIKGLGDIKTYNYYMAPEIMAEFMEIKQNENGYGNSEKTYLTKRETEILKLILHGKNSKSIAKALNISKRTVDGHRANINNKFGVKNTAQLYKKAGSYLLTF